ncbi:hypothetical protein CPB84DRAFT_132707 [Gymnopilus junonius]|uniref:Transmembrane protein n=1 Tax=Gymnopilus junonius TaxID=109634 RepID=A0A9P5NGL9_GYMJU|nr:hypothetical protein CPB84DRAFT_132707 [Gymnopilus junonius]
MQVMYKILMTAYTLCLHFVFFKHLRFRPRANHPLVIANDTILGIHLLTSYDQWATALSMRDRVWKGTSVASTLLLSSSLALLQIDLVNTNYIGRTFALLSCLFASSGLIAAGLCLLIRRKQLDKDCRKKWINASLVSTSLESLDFWTCLAFPTEMIIWQVAYLLPINIIYHRVDRLPK